MQQPLAGKSPFEKKILKKVNFFLEERKNALYLHSLKQKGA